MKIINSDINHAISKGRGLKLNLGAGTSNIAGYYNVDVAELPSTDVLADLNAPLDQLPNDSVGSVYSRAAFEHVENFIGLMEEMHRICIPGADIKIIVPHFSNPYYYSDPTHVRFFGLYTMHYFVNESAQTKRKVPDYYSSVRFDLVKIRMDYYRTTLFDKLFEPIFQRIINFNMHTLDFYERRLAWIYPAWQITYELRVNK